MPQQKPRQQEALNFGLKKSVTLSRHFLISETKALKSGGVTDKLICVFVLHIQNRVVYMTTTNVPSTITYLTQV